MSQWQRRSSAVHGSSMKGKALGQNCLGRTMASEAEARSWPAAGQMRRLVERLAARLTDLRV